MGRLKDINDTRNTLWNRGSSYIIEDYLSEISETLAMMYDKKNENKGEWIPQPSNKEQGERDFVWWKCSKCGQVIYSETEKDREEFHAFCGRCGADMRDNIVSEKEKRNRDIIINMVKDM